jgi:hypothetical protein
LVFQDRVLAELVAEDDAALSLFSKASFEVSLKQWVSLNEGYARFIA